MSHSLSFLPSNATSGLRAAKIRFPNDCGAGEVTALDKGDLHGKAELRIQIAELKVA